MSSLARLWQSQDKRQDAYDLLAPLVILWGSGFLTIVTAPQLQCGMLSFGLEPAKRLSTCPGAGTET